jgi:DNA-binding MarR family transcriptional regulator
MVPRGLGKNLAMTSAGSVRAAAEAVTDAVLTASRLLIAVSASSIAAVDESITIPQFRLLVVLHTRAPMKLSILADHLGVNPSTTTRMVDRLVCTGMVDRQVNPTSRREVVLDLTETGAQTVTRVTQQRRRQIARIVARMPQGHRTQLIEALEAFNDAGGEPPATDPQAEWI